jgi:hypothetical protein
VNGAGGAVGILAAKDGVSVMFRCGRCGHEWTALRSESAHPPEKSDAA